MKIYVEKVLKVYIRFPKSYMNSIVGHKEALILVRKWFLKLTSIFEVTGQGQVTKIQINDLNVLYEEFSLM